MLASRLLLVGLVLETSTFVVESGLLDQLKSTVTTTISNTANKLLGVSGASAFEVEFGPILKELKEKKDWPCVTGAHVIEGHEDQTMLLDEGKVTNKLDFSMRVKDVVENNDGTTSANLEFAVEPLMIIKYNIFYTRKALLNTYERKGDGKITQDKITVTVKATLPSSQDDINAKKASGKCVAEIQSVQAEVTGDYSVGDIQYDSLIGLNLSQRSMQRMMLGLKKDVQLIIKKYVEQNLVTILQNQKSTNICLANNPKMKPLDSTKDYCKRYNESLYYSPP